MLVGHAEPDRVQRVAYALAALGDRLVGQTDDDEGLLTGRDAHLHLDGACLDADEREGRDLPVHVAVQPFMSPVQVGRER